MYIVEIGFDWAWRMFSVVCYCEHCSVYWCWWTVHWTVPVSYKSTFTRRRTFSLRSTPVRGFLAHLTGSVVSWVRQCIAWLWHCWVLCY